MSGKREEFCTPRNIVIEQIDRYEHWMVLSSIDRAGHYRPGSIGETIRRLSPEERAKLKDLKSDDLINVRPRELSVHPAQGRSYKQRSGTRVFRIPHTKP